MVELIQRPHRGSRRVYGLDKTLQGGDREMENSMKPFWELLTNDPDIREVFHDLLELQEVSRQFLYTPVPTGLRAAVADVRRTTDEQLQETHKKLESLVSARLPRLLISAAIEGCISAKSSS